MSVNLSDNAIKYTDSGKIKIGINREYNYLEIYEKDTGIDILKGNIHIVFNCFEQNKNPESKLKEATGLKLTILKKPEKLLGKILTVESQINKDALLFIKDARKLC